MLKQVTANDEIQTRAYTARTQTTVFQIASTQSPPKHLNKKSSGATALQGLGRQSGLRWSAKLVPTFVDRRVSRGQRNGSPRPLISVYLTWIATTKTLGLTKSLTKNAHYYFGVKQSTCWVSSHSILCSILPLHTTRK